MRGEDYRCFCAEGGHLSRAAVKKGIILLLAVGALLLSAFLLYQHTHYRHFDAALWKNNATRSSIRLAMADDLVATQRLNKLSRAGVLDLLGEPLKTPYFKEFDMVYWLGPERAFMSIDSEWLVIKLDSSGHVEEAKIVRD